MDTNQIGDRLKEYENSWKTVLPKRFPYVVRVDGQAFHSYTRGLQKPFDPLLITAMNHCAVELCKMISGSLIAYVQSDEISILVYPYRSRTSEPWVGNSLNKIVSLTSGRASALMTESSKYVFGKTKPATFDSRVFILPVFEVNSYFVWRQQDWIRNSVSTFARSYFSDKDLFGLNGQEIKEKLIAEKQQDWDKLPSHQKYGRIIHKREITRNNAIRNEWHVVDDSTLFQHNKLPEVLLNNVFLTQEEEKKDNA